jgi:Ca-activated chloride channel family protein
MANDEKLEKSGLFTRAGNPVPLQGVEVSGELLGGHARVRVRQRYRNTEPRPVEAIYTFPLPSDGTLTAFSMTCDGRKVQGVLKEREAAFKAYDDAITAGHGAALLDQERPNIFTAQVGNLLPNEETLVEVEFLQKLQAEEGCVRWMLPTLVAPRYIPGTPQGDRTAHGVAEPTDRVPDADRMTPPIGDARYGLTLDLLVDLGREVVVESPSHPLKLTRVGEGKGVRVAFDKAHVALDRDFVLTLRGPDASAPLTTLVTHRQGTEPGTFALTVVPDLLELATVPKAQEVVFVVDTSGSMEGASLPQAQSALRLCLRHLREGDRFNVMAFENSFRTCFPAPVPFTQKTLEEADRWVAALRAGGGTELLQPMVAAVRGMPDGVVVLLTDGEVGNEAEILQAVLAERKTARVYSFGIGTNVSDVLLKDLARQTGGAVEFIHPGERIDDKVVAQFSRALAPRVTELEARFEGVEGTELAPTELPPLVDGVPWTLFGRYATPGMGKVVLKGRSGREPFALTIPVTFSDVSDRPVVEKLWAAERIRGWEAAALVGRRAQSMKERIVQLALAHGIVTKYTSFVVVEERTAERRATTQPETRVVPVNAPAGWSMFADGAADEQDERVVPVRGMPGMPPPAQAIPPPPSVSRPSPQRISASFPAISAPASAPAPVQGAGPGGAQPPSGAPMAPAPRSRAITGSMPTVGAPPPAPPKKESGGFFGRLFGSSSAPPPSPARPAASPPPAARPSAPPPSPARSAPPPSEPLYGTTVEEEPLGMFDSAFDASAAEEPVFADADDDLYAASADEAEFDDVAREKAAPPERAKRKEAASTPLGLLGAQLANGLWAGSGPGAEPVRQARATALALLELLRQGITSSHPLHGAQVKKAVDALLALAASLTGAPDVAELALGVAWLVASGPRTRSRIVQAAQPLASLSQHLGNEVAVRQHVDALATR